MRLRSLRWPRRRADEAGLIATDQPALDSVPTPPRPDLTLSALPGTLTDDEPAGRTRHPGVAVGVAAAVLVAGGWLAVSLLTAHQDVTPGTVAVLTAAQTPADRLETEDVARLAVDPASTRLLVRTDQGAHYVARSLSGELCLVRVPDGDVPTASCVPDRVGADTTLGDQGAGQVRLVADGGPVPAADQGWASAGPNVWVRP